MPKKLKKFFKRQGFTLVELIIVIAIIAILAVAAFMMLTKWLGNSRDSRRLADISIIKKSLDIGFTELPYYPEPDDKGYATNNLGHQMWYVGYFGSGAIEKIDSLRRVPVDPSDNLPYQYGVTLDKQEYQVGTLLESGEEVSMIANVFASKKATDSNKRIITEEDINSTVSSIEGFFDGYATYSTGSSEYIVQTESLLVYKDEIIDVTNETTDALMVNNKTLGEPSTIKLVEFLDTDNNDEKILKVQETFGLNSEGESIGIINNNTKNPVEEITFTPCYLWTGAARELIVHGKSIDVFTETDIAWDASYNCEDRIETRTCNDGVLSGSAMIKYCVKGTPDNCDANPSYSYNGHTYNIPELNHEDTTTSNVNITENNGIYQYTLNLKCFDGNYVDEAENGPTVQSCELDFYSNNGTCTAVGNGYYSTDGSLARSACTTKVASSNYTSDGNGSDNCSWACITDFYLSSGSCLAVGNGYYSPNNNNTRTACTNKPSGSSYTGEGNGTNACPRSRNYARTTSSRTARSGCSKSCGGGSKRRVANCRRGDGTIVNASNCSGTRPRQRASCNTHSCCTRTCDRVNVKRYVECCDCAYSNCYRCDGGKSSTGACHDHRKRHYISTNCSCR